MSGDRDRSDSQMERALGPVYDEVIEGADVYLAGTDDLVARGVDVTIRETAGVPGWVGVVDGDLTELIDFKLELRFPNHAAECGVLFSVAGEVLKRTLIRGTGRTPGDAPKVRSRPRFTSTPRQLR